MTSFINTAATPPGEQMVRTDNPLPVVLSGTGGAAAPGSSSAVASYSKGASSVQSGSLGALNAVALGTFDAADYQSVTVQVAGTFVGTVAFQVSNDNVNWVTKVLTAATGPIVSTTAGAGIYFGDIGARYFRVQMTAWTSGTANITAVYDALSLSSPAQTTLPVTGTVTANPALPSAYSLVTAATTNAALVKATAGSLFELTVSNVTAATIYVKLFNKATAPTVGTDTPIATIPVAAGAYQPLTFAALGKRFTAGIAIAVTGAAAATDTTAVTVGAQISGSFI